jgi:hypothetical protein
MVMELQVNPGNLMDHERRVTNFAIPLEKNSDLVEAGVPESNVSFMSVKFAHTSQTMSHFGPWMLWNHFNDQRSKGYRSKLRANQDVWKSFLVHFCLSSARHQQSWLAWVPGQ